MSAAPGVTTRIEVCESDDGPLVWTFDPDEYESPELVPDTAAGNAGSAIPTTAVAPAATYSGGSILPAEAPQIVNAPPPRTNTTERVLVQIRRPRPRGAGKPAARRAAGPRSGSDPGSSDPDEPSPSCRLDGGKGVARRIADRRLDGRAA